MANQLLTKTEIEHVLEQVYETLETVGVRFDNEEALEMFKKRGAKVEGTRVYFTEALIGEALKVMPKSEYPPVKKSERRLTGQLFYGVPTILDDDTGQYKDAAIADVIKMYKLGETSDLYEGSGIAIVDPYDNDAEDRYVGQIAMLLKHSDKSISNGLRAHASNARNGDIYRSAWNGIQLIKDFYGVTGDEIVMTQIICPNSPLDYDDESLYNIKAAVDHGQGVVICPCTMGNLTGPGSIYGINVHDFAFSLAGIAYIQFLRPGSVVTLCSCSAPTDRRSLQPVFASPEAMYVFTMFYELCRYYEIGCSVCTLLSDSPVVDYQSGLESMMTSLLPFMLTDLDIGYAYPGLMSAFSSGSFIKAMYDEELIRYANRALQGIGQVLNPDTPEHIRIGRDRNMFISSRTQAEFDEGNYLPKLFNKQGVVRGADPDSIDPKVKAEKEIERRLKMYELPERTREQRNLLQKHLPTLARY